MEWNPKPAPPRWRVPRSAASNRATSCPRGRPTPTTYVAPNIASIVFEQRRKASPSAAMHALTSRERQVLALVAEGYTDQQAAARLNIGVRTVRSHLDHIRTKTGRRRRAELTRLAIDEGVVGG